MNLKVRNCPPVGKYGDRFVVTVRPARHVNALVPRVTVYSALRGIYEEFPVSNAMEVAMGDSSKRYFWSRMEGDTLILDERAGAEAK